MSGYETVCSCKVAGVPVRKMRSTRSGLVVCLAEVEGPIVNGFFCLATEAHDHDGLPHTLEHLVFMGSELYPYKGVLDQLANRCLSQGTNAWTDVDHTAYTMTTAGSQGFLQLMPIYLDHILYPTLTDAAYLTEVHHVNGEGDDAGVVYCEMQARENTAQDRTHFHLLQHMYPEGCGYRSETGGRLINLRTSCSNQKVHAYHKHFYRPDNLCLIVTGQVTVEELWHSLKPFEDKILSKGPLPAMERPWGSAVPPLEASQCEEVPFPSSEEGDGLCRVGWRGPPAVDRLAVATMAVLVSYLRESSISPLQAGLVEVPEPFCSKISQLFMENSQTCVGFTLKGVPVEKMAELKAKVMSILSGIGTGKDPLDLMRMRTIIRREIQNLHDSVEEKPHFFFAFGMIGDFLFGRSPQDFEAHINQESCLRTLLEEPTDFWVEMINKYFVKGPHVMILGRPSKELDAKNAAEEKERVERQREGLGEGGMKEKAERLEEAIQLNEVPVASEVLSNLRVPSTEKISFHPLVAMGNYRPSTQVDQGCPEYSKLPVFSIPFFFQLNHVHSPFVKVTVALDTAVLPLPLRPYLPLYLGLLFESPIVREGKVIPYEEVVKQLEEDTVSTNAALGVGGRSFQQTIIVTLKVEAEKYPSGIRWMQEVLFQNQFTSKRLSVVASKLLNDLNTEKRNGLVVAKTLHRQLVFSKESNLNQSNMVTQLKFLTATQASLKENGSEAQAEVLKDMRCIHEMLTAADNLKVFLSMDVNNIPSSLLDSWKNFLPADHPPPQHTPSTVPSILPSLHFLNPHVFGTRVAGVGGVESNFLVQSVPCVASCDHPDYPAILVFCQYLKALEGPMWRQIRGMGLSYHYNLYPSPEHGLLYFVLFMSSQLAQAYQVAQSIVDGYLSGSAVFEGTGLEGAVSGVVYQTIEGEETVAGAVRLSLLRYLQGVEPSFSKVLLKAVSEVTIADLNRVGKEYFCKLFDPKLASCAICCNPSKATDVKMVFEKMGHSVELIEDLDKTASI